MPAGYNTSTAFLEALAEAGVSYLFASLGRDHPVLIEALAQARTQGREEELPRLIVCPHETVALSAAHAYASVTRRPQAVLVPVDAGTQNLGGAVTNAMRARVPVLIFAGAAPFTMAGVKYGQEIRTGRNVKQVVHRALQIARSEPAGPVYLVGPREVMEEPLEPEAVDQAQYTPVAPVALTAGLTGEIATALARARRPLVVTSYLGRNPAAVPALVHLAELLALPVLESAAFCVNFPGDHPLHCGYQFTTGEQNPLLDRADVILVVDSDVPWIPAGNQPSPGAAIYALDIDPLKTAMSMWHIPARRFAAADSKVALEQIARLARDENLAEPGVVETRRAETAAANAERRAALDALEQPEAGVITPRYLTATVRDLLHGTDALVLTETITNCQVVAEHLRASRPGSMIGSGGGAPGWAGGGAVGAKLASSSERTVVSLVGDGSYLSGVPASAQWVARRYHAPSLTVIYDNHGWAAPKFSALRVHPSGAAAAADDIHVSFEPAPDLPGIAAAAGGAYAVTVTDPADLSRTLRDALAVVRGGRSAVVGVRLPPV